MPCKDRCTVSVTGNTYAKLLARCSELGITVSSAVNQLLDSQGLRRGLATIRASEYAGPEAAEAAGQGGGAAGLSGPRLKATRAIVVDEGTAELLDDQVTRERQLHGREVTPGRLLDAAINRFLDTQGWPATQGGGAQ